METNLSALPRLGQPSWLHAWIKGAPPEPAADAAARDVLVVAYGLVRSLPTLVRTMASLQQYGPPKARLAVVAQCAPAECSGASALISRHGPQTLALVEARAGHSTTPRSVCADANASAPRAAQHAVYYTAHRALIALVDWNADAVVLWRLDTELRTPIDVRALAPWTHCHDCVHVPCMQHGTLLNDRFAYGSARAMRRFQTARVAHMQRHCEYGETAALTAARVAHLRVAFTRVCVVRVRADGYVPDVDQSAVLASIPARSWMKKISALSPALRCNATTKPTPQCTIASP